jgi:drug/metabolite transporter (DMT)-like permease
MQSPISGARSSGAASRASVQGIGAALLGAIAYGANIPAARVAGQLGVDGATQMALRNVVLVGGILLVTLLLGRSLAVSAQNRPRLIAMGLAAGCTAMGYLSALSFVPVAVAVTLFYLFPLWLILAEPIVFRRRLAPRRLAAFAVAFLGIVLCVGPALGALDWRGVALAVVAGFGSAAMFLLQSGLREDRVAIIAWTQTIALLVAIPVVAVIGLAPLASIEAAALPVAFSAIGFYLGFLLQVVAVSLIAPALAGLLFLVEPIVAILIAALVLGEALSVTQIAGITLVLGALATDLLLEMRVAPHPSTAP